MPVSAAVTIITISNQQVLILKRAHNPLDPWSGHLSLPGGRIEDDDETPLEAAKRETMEEVGIDLSDLQPSSTLPVELAGLSADHAIKVLPSHFELSHKPHIELQLEEHDDYYWVDLNYLNDLGNHRRKALSKDFPERIFSCVHIEGTELWGFTYKVLNDFLGWNSCLE